MNAVGETPSVATAESYVRTVEVVALDTLSKLLGYDYRRFTLPDATFNIYERGYHSKPETIEVARCVDIDLLPHPAWKICGGDRYFVEEIGHSDKLAIRGVEHWAHFGGKFDIRKIAPLVRIPQSDGPFFLVGGDKNHYHWVLNFVPRLLTLERLRHESPEITGDMKLVIPAEVSDNSIGLIEALGYRRENIVQLHQNAIWRFEELYVPSFFVHSELSPAIFSWYRERLGLPVSGKGKRRIIISRGDASAGTQRRRVMNEDDMLSALSKVGFERQVLSDLSVSEQIALFSDAEFVIGPHGAGFVNMLFSRPGTKAIVLENSWKHTFMVDLVNVAGGNAIDLVCEDVVDEAFEATFAHQPAIANELKRNRDMLVDIDRLLQEVKRLDG